MKLPHLSPSPCEHHLPPHATQPRRGQDAIAPGTPQTLRPLAAFRDPHFRLSPLPQVSPLPGVSLLGSPTSGYPSLSRVPSPGPQGHGRARGHSPARLRGGARVSRRREPRPAARAERPALPAGPAPPLAPEVTRQGVRRQAAPSVRMCMSGRGVVFGSTWRPESARWDRSQGEAGWEEGECQQA